MNRSASGIVRRLGAVVAGLVLAWAATVAVAAPAQAAPPAPNAPPGCFYAAGHYESAGSFITAYRYWLCEEGDDIPLSVSIERYLSPNVWQVVASGTGTTTYYCAGSAYNVYRTTGTSQFAILCT
jgi:hypothetical protein